MNIRCIFLKLCFKKKKTYTSKWQLPITERRSQPRLLGTEDTSQEVPLRYEGSEDTENAKLSKPLSTTEASKFPPVLRIGPAERGIAVKAFGGWSGADNF